MAGQQIPPDLQAGALLAMIERAMLVPGMRLTLSRVPQGYAPAPFYATASWSSPGTGPVQKIDFPTAHRQDPLEALAFVIRHAFTHGNVQEVPVDMEPPSRPAVVLTARHSVDEVEDLLADDDDEVEELLAL